MIACPRCGTELTDGEIRTLRAQYARSKVQNPKPGTGRPRKPAHDYDSHCRCRVCEELRKAIRKSPDFPLANRGNRAYD